MPEAPFTTEHEDLRASLRRFIENELRPHAMEWEEARWFPNEVFTKLASHGFLGLKYPEEYGGQGGDYLHDAVLTEELAGCGSGGLAAGIGAHVGIATPPDPHRAISSAKTASCRWSPPSPPYSSGYFRPRKPTRASAPKTSSGNQRASSHSDACGRSSLATKRRIESRSSSCSAANGFIHRTLTDDFRWLVWS